MNVTVIIVAYHGDQWLPACIDSLVGASTQRIHLVLVDNFGNSMLGSLSLERFDYEIVKTPRPMGFAEANNFALIHALHLDDAVLFLNQDTISHPGWIDHCLDCLAYDEQLGAISPLIQTYDSSAWDPDFLACITAEETLRNLPTSTNHFGDWFYEEKAPAPALIIRADVLRLAGPFDPVFGSYYEDYDLCRRIRNSGFRIGFCRSARIAHFSGSTTNSQARERRRMRQIIRNRLLYQLRESGEPRLFMVLKHTLVEFPRRLARGILRTPSSHPPSVILKAHWDLLQISGRIISRRFDEKAWERYLIEIGWPYCVSGAVTR